MPTVAPLGGGGGGSGSGANSQGWGAFLRILGEGAPPGSPNSDPVSEQNYVIFQYPISDLFSKIHISFQNCPVKFIPISVSQTTMVSICTHFQTKTAQKPYLLGRHTPVSLPYTREYPSGVSNPQLSDYQTSTSVVHARPVFTYENTK